MATPSIVVVTEPEFRRAEAVFRSAYGMTCVPAAPEEEALAHAIADRGARYAVVGSVVYRGPLYEAIPRGGLIARYGVGHDGIDKAIATRAGIFCTNTPGVLHQSVAELTMLLVLAAARHLRPEAGGVRDGLWAPHTGVELHGRTLAIIGCGAIGGAVARIASAGFGMQVVGCRRSHAAATTAGTRDDDRHFDTVTSDFTDAVREADYVSLHIPASAENARFINRERLAQLRPEAWLINTARGAVVDEAALYDVLKTGGLGGAALDVYDREPYQPADPGRDLRTLSNVILTPHVGSNTAEANRRMGERALRNIMLAERGELGSMDLLNRDVLP